MEYCPTRLAQRNNTTINAHGVELLTNTTVDFQYLQTWSYKPYMVEGNVCEFTSPLCCNANTTKDCQDIVTQLFPKLKAFVRDFVDAVDTVYTSRLGYHIVKPKTLKKYIILIIRH